MEGDPDQANRKQRQRDVCKINAMVASIVLKPGDVELEDPMSASANLATGSVDYANFAPTSHGGYDNWGEQAVYGDGWSEQDWKRDGTGGSSDVDLSQFCG